MGLGSSPGEKKTDKPEPTQDKSEKPLEQMNSIQGADVAKSEEVSVPDPFFMFCNYAIDYGTARIMSYVWPACNIIILKLVNFLKIEIYLKSQKN
jgi:hypothetical protein